MPSELQAKLRELREAHPGWGPESLLATLRADPSWNTTHLPSRPRVAAFLKQEGLTRKYQRQVDLPQPPLRIPLDPHDEWQMDAQGIGQVEGVGSRECDQYRGCDQSAAAVESSPRLLTSRLDSR